MDIDGQAISRILYSGSGALTPDRIMAIYLAVPVMKTETDLLRSTRNCSPDADRQSEVKTGRLFSFLFDLAPGGVYLASAITVGAVVSYTAISPLSRYLQGDVGTVSFLWHFPFSAHYCGSPRHYTGAPCPVESGLSSGRLACATGQRPASGAPAVKDLMCETGPAYIERYSIRPQKSQSVKVSGFRDSTTCEGESFI